MTRLHQPPQLWTPGLALAVFCACLAGAMPAAETNGPPEMWLTNAIVHPAAAAGPVQSNRFLQLRMDYMAETARVLWTPPAGDAVTNAILRLSVDEPGHWPARDWRSHPMQRRGPDWERIIPVDTLDVPLVYYVEAASEQEVALSPLRVCQPRLLGLEMPTRVFWPFLEGFEEGFESWRWIAGGPADGRFETSTPVKNGKAALSVRIPPFKSSVTLGTTRVRGWLALEHEATGVALWMRTRQGTGRVRFALLTQAFTTNQVVAARAGEVPIQDAWQQVELPFSDFSKFVLSELDFFTIELLGPAGTEFLLDDLQLLGRWFLK